MNAKQYYDSQIDYGKGIKALSRAFSLNLKYQYTVCSLPPFHGESLRSHWRLYNFNPFPRNPLFSEIFLPLVEIEVDRIFYKRPKDQANREASHLDHKIVYEFMRLREHYMYHALSIDNLVCLLVIGLYLESYWIDKEIAVSIAVDSYLDHPDIFANFSIEYLQALESSCRTAYPSYPLTMEDVITMAIGLEKSKYKNNKVVESGRI